MYQCKGADCLYAKPLLFNLCIHCLTRRNVQGDGEDGNLRQRRVVTILQLIIAVPEMCDIENVIHDCSTLDMGDNEVAMVSKEMKDNNFGGAAGDEAPFLPEIADILSSVEFVVGHSKVSSLLVIIHLAVLTVMFIRNT